MLLLLLLLLLLPHCWIILSFVDISLVRPLPILYAFFSSSSSSSSSTSLPPSLPLQLSTPSLPSLPPSLPPYPALTLTPTKEASKANPTAVAKILQRAFRAAFRRRSVPRSVQASST